MKNDNAQSVTEKKETAIALLEAAIKPAITSVQLCSVDDTGVGPSIASGNQPDCAEKHDFVRRAMKNKMCMLDNIFSVLTNEKYPDAINSTRQTSPILFQPIAM